MSSIDNNVFILTGDEPVAESKLKRLVLQHQRIYFSDISDKAIINDNEVIENFNAMNVWWAARGHYPRVSDYDERYNVLMSGISSLINRRIVNPINTSDVKSLDSGTHWVAHNVALSQDKLVRAAGIDANISNPDLILPNTLLSGGVIAPSGRKSKYEIDCKPRAKIDGVSDDWAWICHLRVGRALKAMRLAQVLGASPIAIDPINSSLSLAFLSNASSLSNSNEDIINFSFETSVIDNKKLESELENISWEDVLYLRKQTLPMMAKSKELMRKKLSKINGYTAKEPHEFLMALEGLKDEFDLLKEAEKEAWESLRIGSILKFGGAAGALGLGSIAIPSPVTLTQSIAALFSAGLLASAAIKDEIISLVPARRKVKEHPLFLIEECKYLPLR